jgi:hypothetical protein
VHFPNPPSSNPMRATTTTESPTNCPVGQAWFQQDSGAPGDCFTPREG